MVDLVAKAKWVRQQLFEMGVPLPSTFSCVEIMVALYYEIKRPQDIVVISKGHGASVRYPILEDLGLIPAGSLKEYRNPGALLKLYAEPSIPETHVPCASLGIGFGVAAGMALAHPEKKVYVLLGDSETYEGSIWETALWASHHHLTNLVVIVDRNMNGVMDNTERCVSLEGPHGYDSKWLSFGWSFFNCDGHDFDEIVAGLKGGSEQIGLPVDRPFVMIAHTIKAKGLSFWEDQPNTHSAVLSEAQKVQARKELYDPA